MKATLICANTLRSAKIAVDKKLSALNPTDLDVKNFVIVPDRSTLDAETALLKTLGGSFNTQVVTFKNLANKLVSTSLNYLNKQNGILLINKIAYEKKDELVCFSKSFDTDGFAEKLYELISAFKYARISPQLLSAEDLPDALKNKLKDVRLLYAEYLDASADRFVDSADTLELLLDCLDKNTVGNWRIFIYDFLSFTEQEKQIVRRLLQNAKHVTLSAVVNEEKTKSAIFDNAVAIAFRQLCKEEGVQLSTEYFSAHASALAKEVYDVFFTDRKIAKKPSENIAVTLRVAADKEGEVKSLARHIDAYVKNGGLYKDVKVVCSDVAAYSFAILKQFGDYKIPFYLDEKTSLDSTLPARYLLAFLENHSLNHPLDKVLAFAKNTLFGQDVSAFETFCKKYNVSYRYDEFEIGTEDELFVFAEETRKAVKKYLCDVQVPAVATAKEFVGILANVFEEHGLQKKIEEHAEKLRNYGQEREAEALLQSSKKIFEVFGQVEIIFGDQQLTTERFVLGLTSSLASQTISVLPAKTDCVFVSNLDKGKNHDVRVLAILGANEGELPKTYKDCALLSDKNLLELEERGLSVDLSLAQKNRQEKFLLYNLLCEPSQALYLSYKTRQGKEGVRPSFAVNALKNAFGLEEDKTQPFAENAKTVRDQAIVAQSLLKEGMAISESQRACLSVAGESVKKYDVFCEEVTALNNGEKLFLNGDAFSVTKIESFFKCPFAHFLSNGVKLKEEEKAELKSSDFGNILHAVFEKFVDRVIKGQSSQEEDAVALFEKVMQEARYKAIAKTAKGKAFCKKLLKEAVLHCIQLKKEMENSDFAPFATEFRFDKSNNTLSLVLNNGKKLFLKGTADRIDTFEDKALIFDYKTGSPSFGESELFAGVKLQLFIYAMAVKKSLKKTPIGSVYYKIKNPAVATQKCKLIGRVTKDVTLLKQIDKGVSREEGGELLGTCLTKKGTVNEKYSLFVPADMLSDYEKYAELMIKKACQLMSEGYIAVNPYGGACEYCNAKGICGFGDTRLLSVRKVSTVKAEDISRIVAEVQND